MPTKTPATTLERLTKLLQDRIEPTEPVDTIRKYFEAHDGKQFTERDVKKLRTLTGDDSIRLVKNFNMSNLQWGGWGMSSGDAGGSMLIAYSVSNITVDAKFIVNYNTCYFAARDQRNARRQQALSDADMLAHVAHVMDDYNHAIQQAKALKRELDRFTQYGAVLYDDNTSIEKLLDAVDGDE